jgi:hypothetical protein
MSDPKSPESDVAALVGELPFQRRVHEWILACFGSEIGSDRIERNHRFIEEALELVQANGCTRSEALQLVAYVYDRPVGEPHQEVGGVMNTLAALCTASGLDMAECGETELTRVWTKVEKIRAKQAAKPKHSPLPEHALSSKVKQAGEPGAVAVKPLVWFERNPLLWHADTPFGPYSAYIDGTWAGPWCNGNDDTGSFDTAKAAAQADYETRIRSSLLPAAPLKGEAVAGDEIVARLAKLKVWDDHPSNGSLGEMAAAEITRLREALAAETKARETAEAEHEKTAAELNRWIKMHAALEATSTTLRAELAKAREALSKIRGLSMHARGEQGNRDALRAILRTSVTALTSISDGAPKGGE